MNPSTLNIKLKGPYEHPFPPPLTLDIKFKGPYELNLPKSKTTGEKFYLSALKLTDILQIVSLLEPTNINSIDIHKNTSSIPNPYKYSDAVFFVNRCIIDYRKSLQCNMWAIRNLKDDYIGGIGLHHIGEKYFIEDEQDKKLFINAYEIGYYLSSEYRGLGIVSSAVNFVCNNIAFKELNLDYVLALTFVDNEKSQNVLKRCGFKFVKLLKNAIEKNGEKKDANWFIKEREVDQIQ
jgi:RimJ/RimL family protein N-acetyltransferase